MARCGLFVGLGVALGACASTPAEPVAFELTLENVARPEANTYELTLSPGWAEIGDTPLFVPREPASEGLEHLAEAGDPTLLLSDTGAPFPSEWAEGYAAAPLVSGERFALRFEALAGDRLSFATMFIASNDVFVGADVPLFEDDEPVEGELRASLYDAGTERNEAPGEGAHQPRSGTGGTDEDGVVTPIVGTDVEGHVYPDVESFLRVRLRRCASDDAC